MVSGGSAALSGLTISGGMAGTDGGGVYNRGGTVTLTDCFVIQNFASGDGGGLANTASGTLTLNHCTVGQNSVSEGTSGSLGLGGGIWNAGTATITDCSISANTGTDGGGLYNDRKGVLLLTDDIVSGNQAQGHGSGGGLYNSTSGWTTMTDCTVSNNLAVVGGGGGLYSAGTLSLTACNVSNNSYFNPYGNDVDAIGGGGLCSRGTTTLTDCTVSSNDADMLGNGEGDFWLSGGGLIVFEGTTTLTNCTISGNIGGGLLISASATLTNCTISANYDGGLSFGGNNAAATLTNTIVAAQASGGDVVGSFKGANNLIGGNPLLGPLGDYGGLTWTMPLLPGSPAIGAGTTAAAPATDQRGQPRTGHVDIGAFQSQGFVLTPVAGSTPQSTKFGRPFAQPLAVAVTAVNPVEPVDGGVVNFAAPATGAARRSRRQQ